jgi:hypothetical protein
MVRKIHREATVVSFGGPEDLAAVDTALASPSTKLGSS